MRTNQNSLRLLLLFIVVIGISSTASAQKSNDLQTAVIKTTIYCDHCKVCESCVGKLEKEFFFEKGIKRVTLDEKAMTLTVVYNSKKTDLNKIKLAISKLGFDADDIKADPAGVEKLDGCCKKS